MSQLLANLAAKHTGKKLTRKALLALQPEKTYDDGRTKQAYKDDCDIGKIMARADKSGTISHLEKFQGTYADFSDYDFHENTRKMTRGREIFDQLPAELRKEFSQSPAQFFAYVNDPKNAKDLMAKLPALAAPGKQLSPAETPSADLAASQAAAELPVVDATPAIAETPAPAET